MAAIEDLRSAGLSGYEAKAYQALLIYGQGTGREISNESGVPQPRIFDVLENLAEKGLAQVIQREPKIWRAIKPDIAISSMIARKIEGYGSLREKLLKELRSIKTEKEKAVHERVTIVSGYEKMYSYINIYAKKTLKGVIVYSVGEPIPTSTQVEHARAVNRGVKIRMIATVYDENNREVVQKRLKDGWLVRHLPGPKEYGYEVFDKESCILGIKDSHERDNRVAIAFDGTSDFVGMLCEHFDLLWSRAKPVYRE